MNKQEQLEYLAQHASTGERLGLGNLKPLFEAMIEAQQDGDPKPYALTVEVEDSEEPERKITTAQEVIDAYIAIANADPTAAPMVRAHLQGVVLEFTQMEITEGQVVATMAVAGEPDAHYTMTLTQTPGESVFRYVTPPQPEGPKLIKFAIQNYGEFTLPLNTELDAVSPARVFSAEEFYTQIEKQPLTLTMRTVGENIESQRIDSWPGGEQVNPYNAENAFGYARAQNTPTDLVYMVQYEASPMLACVIARDFIDELVKLTSTPIPSPFTMTVSAVK